MKLNSFLVADELVIGKFDRTLKRLKKRFNPQIGIVDFAYFSHRRLIKVRRQMLKHEKTQNSEYLENLYKLERVCLSYIELKKLFSLDKSTFLYEENFLLYCHTGTSKNDPQILNLVSLDDRNIKLNILT